MISLVVCSVDDTIFNRFQANVSQTIGTAFEIIKITDAKETGGICAAYNSGAAKAQYDHICFCHDDILFHTQNWGQQVIENLSPESTGLIAVAGATCKTASPSPWWVSNFYSFDKYCFSAVLQHTGGRLLEKAAAATDFNSKEILVADGVWLCCKKAVWQKAGFDQKTFTGFHFYDLDFSLTLNRQGYKNYLLTSIGIEHFSAGNLNRAWIEDAIRFHQKWSAVLPLAVNTLAETEKASLEKEALKNWLIILNQNQYPNRLLWLRYWCMYFKKNKTGKQTWSFLFRKFFTQNN